MTANLPPGFDPAIWKGWKAAEEAQNYSKPMIYRPASDGTGIGVFYNPETIIAGFTINEHWRVLSTPPGASYSGTEPEAAAFCKKYADSHGGWVTP